MSRCIRERLQIVRWLAVADIKALQLEASQRICAAAEAAIAARGVFQLVLAGGHTPRGVYAHLGDADAAWSRWQIYFGDERCLPASDTARNSQMAATQWLNHVAITPQQIHMIPAELGPEQAARAYAETLQAVGDFDLVLLGLGEDGHTASLFAHHELGTNSDAPDVLAVFDAPQAVTQRVSLSAARLSRTRAALYLVAGETKRTAVARWHAGEALPAAMIRPLAGVDVLIESTLLGPHPD